MATLVWVTVCVGEWSRRPWYNSTFIHGRQVALALVIRQWRSRVGRWLGQSSHSTAEQSTTTTTRPRRHKLHVKLWSPTRLCYNELTSQLYIVHSSSSERSPCSNVISVLNLFWVWVTDSSLLHSHSLHWYTVT